MLRENLSTCSEKLKGESAKVPDVTSLLQFIFPVSHGFYLQLKDDATFDELDREDISIGDDNSSWESSKSQLKAELLLCWIFLKITSVLLNKRIDCHDNTLVLKYY